ncbi:metallophosphoesterase family protein [Prosthecobacter vanneervenii]|uniref:Icc-related predicted phosphoesterase n=1 Tax=Prosthecobacter vanneervenii TaxID=48466 RepID=A0A7W8DIE8_9BACT|nr:metallophosphoesterase [Prosthecobacter vanneervenii]MBB5031099.1 Icc-related predicted phosphoesterase [Prosthecobacter vanneervenii]
MPTRILIATDLHQRAVLYAALIKLADEVKPDAIILGGDFLHGTGMLPYGQTPQLTPTLCAVELQSIKQPLFFVRGNHEDENWLEFSQVWQSLHERSPSRLHGSFTMIGEVGVVGFPCAMGQEEAFSEGVPLGGKHYSAWLPRLVAEHGDLANQLWIMHEPPTGTQLTLAGSAVEGHEWWWDAIEEHQPELVVCGHDHTTPIRRNVWRDRIGKTTVVNVGQNMDGPLHATLVTQDATSGELQCERLQMNGGLCPNILLDAQDASGMMLGSCIAAFSPADPPHASPAGKPGR